MLEPPDLADEAIVGALEAGYGILIRALTFLPFGADSASAAYRIDTVEGASYFLKIRTLDGFSSLSLLVPRFLHDQGVPHVLSPLPAISQAPWVVVGNSALGLFPFVEGHRAADVGLSELHWSSLGTMLRQIHTSQLPPALMEIVPRESFTPSRRAVLTRLEAQVNVELSPDPLKRELAAFWKARRAEIASLIDRADALGHRLRSRPAPLVLCHADLHTWNVLLDPSQQMWVVDWDETLLSLKERDLMFVVGGIGADQVRIHQTACFLRGYGDVAIDPLALSYFRYAWAVQDVGAYGDQVYFLPDLGEETRRNALEGFMDMFEPGNIVAIALGSDGAKV